MLGTHDHSTRKHTKNEAIQNFAILFLSQIVLELLKKYPNAPTPLDLYYSLLFAFSVSLGFYGYNKIVEKKMETNKNV